MRWPGRKEVGEPPSERPRIYPVLDIPLTCPFQELDKVTGREFFKWYVENRDERVRIITSHLGLSEPHSVDDLRNAVLLAGEWLKRHACQTSLTLAQAQRQREIVGKFAHPDDRLGVGLSHETLAFCFDMGALLGKLFEELIPGSKLKIQLGGKSNADYGHILSGVTPDRYGINTYRICRVLALKAIDGDDLSIFIPSMIHANLDTRMPEP